MFALRAVLRREGFVKLNPRVHARQFFGSETLLPRRVRSGPSSAFTHARVPHNKNNNNNNNNNFFRWSYPLATSSTSLDSVLGSSRPYSADSSFPDNHGIRKDERLDSEKFPWVKKHRFFSEVKCLVNRTEELRTLFGSIDKALDDGEFPKDTGVLVDSVDGFPFSLLEGQYLIRQAVLDVTAMFDLNVMRRYVLTGTSGIGKSTTCTAVLLHRLLHSSTAIPGKLTVVTLCAKKRKFLFVRDAAKVFAFEISPTTDTSYLNNYLVPVANVWSLVDGETGAINKDPFFYDHGAAVLIASQGVFRNATHQHFKRGVSSDTYILIPPSKTEMSMIISDEVLEPVLGANGLRKALGIFGARPRVLMALEKENLKSCVNDMIKAAEEVNDVWKLIYTPGNLKGVFSGGSDKLLDCKTEDGTPGGTKRFDIASPFARHLVMRKGTDVDKALAGALFAATTICQLLSRSFEIDLLSNASDPASGTPGAELTTARLPFEDVVRYDFLPSHIRPNVLYLPLNRANPMFNAFIVYEDPANSRYSVALIQITISAKHPISKKGFPLIRRIVSGLENESAKTAISLFFAVPPQLREGIDDHEVLKLLEDVKAIPDDVLSKTPANNKVLDVEQPVKEKYSGTKIAPLEFTQWKMTLAADGNPNLTSTPLQKILFDRPGTDWLENQDIAPSVRDDFIELAHESGNLEVQPAVLLRTFLRENEENVEGTKDELIARIVRLLDRW